MQLRFIRFAVALILLAAPVSLKAQAVTLPEGFYVFLIQGVSGDLPFGAANQAALIGSFVADGNGTITRGVADFNSPLSTQLNVPLTGTYTTESNQEIVVTLTTGMGTQTLVIPPPPDHLFNVAMSKWYMTTAAPGAISGSGTLTVQNAATFSPGHVLGAYTSLIRGESACDTKCLLAGSHARVITGSGSLTISSPTTSFSTEFRESIGTAVRAGESSGPILPLNPYFFPYGRMMLQATSQKQTGFPTSFVAYIVDETHLVFMSIDAHSRTDLASGSAFEPGAGLSPAVVRAGSQELSREP